MFRYRPLIRVEDYAPFIGAEAVERIRQKAKPLQGLHVTHVNSTYYGGGVATLLDSLTSLMSSIQGRLISSASPRKCTMLSTAVISI